MKSFKKAFFLTSFCLVLIFSMLPLQAFAAQPDLTFSAPFAEPHVDDDSFYIEVLYQNRNNPEQFNVHVYSFDLTVLYDAQPSTSVDIENIVYPSVQLGQTSSYGNNVTVWFYTTLNHTVEAFYTFCDYSVEYNTVQYFNKTVFNSGTSHPIRGDDNWSIVSANFIGIVPNSPKSYSYTFTVSYNNSDDVYSRLQEIINNLYVLHSDNVEQVNKLLDIINSLVTLHSDNVDQLNKLVEILTVDNKINSILNRIFEYLTEEQSFVLTDIDFLLMDTNAKLDTIIDLLQPDTDVNVSKVDPSNFNEYNKAEQSLLDNNNVDVSSALKVEVDQNALLYIWPLAEEVLNTHPQVIGLVITILSISIVALVLGRKGG